MHLAGLKGNNKFKDNLNQTILYYLKTVKYICSSHQVVYAGQYWKHYHLQGFFSV